MNQNHRRTSVDLRVFRDDQGAARHTRVSAQRPRARRINSASGSKGPLQRVGGIDSHPQQAPRERRRPAVGEPGDRQSSRSPAMARPGRFARCRTPAGRFLGGAGRWDSRGKALALTHRRSGSNPRLPVSGNGDRRLVQLGNWSAGNNRNRAHRAPGKPAALLRSMPCQSVGRGHEASIIARRDDLPASSTAVFSQMLEGSTGVSAATGTAAAGIPCLRSLCTRNTAAAISANAST